MKKLLVFIAGLAVLGAPAAMAEQDGSGCGLGKMIFEGQSGMVPHVLAATSNGISGNQTIGITFGTSGCDADSVILKEREQETFVAANYDSLGQDMATGDGQYLRALSSLMGCSATAYGELARVTQREFATLVPAGAPDPAALLNGLKQELAVHPHLSVACTRIS